MVIERVINEAYTRYENFGPKVQKMVNVLIPTAGLDMVAIGGVMLKQANTFGPWGMLAGAVGVVTLLTYTAVRLGIGEQKS